MYINEAMKQIKETVRAYLATDEFGNYLIPIQRQRPICLIGAPGLGKTAIMEQAARELKINLVSYSMTHHTRQSALGLPFIEDKSFAGADSKVTLYTMSEIIAELHSKMEETGIRQGILFLDEINCVSETLSPAMLQFLQYKVFGTHRVPDGWVIVCAGNPPEYNNSVREFDVVTWDRLKKIEITESYTVWKEYAVNEGNVHSAVLNFLDSNENYFYKIENLGGGRKRFTTARSWCDLSEIIRIYEKLKEKSDYASDDFRIDENLIGQYIQDPVIAREFAAFYELYTKYRQDYKVSEILAGNFPEHVINRARNAAFDEHHALLGILLSAIFTRISEVSEQQKMFIQLFNIFKAFGETMRKDGELLTSLIEEKIAELRSELEAKKKAGHTTNADEHLDNLVIRELEAYLRHFRLNSGIVDAGADASYEELRRLFNPARAKLNQAIADVIDQINNIYIFCEKAFCSGGTEDREIFILTKELTLYRQFADNFCDERCYKYFEYNNRLHVTGEDEMLRKKVEEVLDMGEVL